MYEECVNLKSLEPDKGLNVCDWCMRAPIKWIVASISFNQNEDGSVDGIQHLSLCENCHDTIFLKSIVDTEESIIGKFHEEREGEDII